MALVLVTAVMTVYRIVLVIGVVIQQLMNVVFAMVITQVVLMHAVCQMVITTSWRATGECGISLVMDRSITPSAGGVRLKRPDLRKLAIRRTSGCGKFAPRGEGGGAIELEIVTAVEMAFLVEVVVN